MVRPVKRRGTQVLFVLVQIAITRHENAVTVFEKCAGIHELPIAVDDEPRIVVQHRGHAETGSEGLRQRSGANINGEMAAPGERIEAHVAKRFWKPAARVVADQQDRQLGQRIQHPVRPWLVGSQ